MLLQVAKWLESHTVEESHGLCVASSHSLDSQDVALLIAHVTREMFLQMLLETFSEESRLIENELIIFETPYLNILKIKFFSM